MIHQPSCQMQYYPKTPLPQPSKVTGCNYQENKSIPYNNTYHISRPDINVSHMDNNCSNYIQDQSFIESFAARGGARGGSSGGAALAGYAAKALLGGGKKPSTTATLTGTQNQTLSGSLAGTQPQGGSSQQTNSTIGKSKTLNKIFGKR